MRLISKQAHFASKYRETLGITEQCESEIIKKAKQFVERECRVSRAEEILCDEYFDWREESGWNDVYGADVEASDIIEFRD